MSRLLTEKHLKEAAAELKAGGVVAFPTETVYGLGASAFREEAIRHVYALKGRPSDNPLIVHIPDASWLERVAVDIPAEAELLFKHFAPGPLTLVLARRMDVPDIVSAGLPTVAVRIPAHPLAQALIRAAGVPLVAPSANRSGKPSPTTAQHVHADYPDVDLPILDGGACAVGVESTVLDLTVTPPAILRPGQITAEMILAKTGLVVVSESSIAKAPKSPGQKYRHYAPQATVLPLPTGVSWDTSIRTLAVQDPRHIGVMVDEATYATIDRVGVQAYLYGAKPDATLAAQALFAALRDLDARGVYWIIVPSFLNEPDAVAYEDRVRRAATPVQRILFVCTGNTCRSPMAAALFNHHAPQGWVASSAGLAAYPGDPAASHAVQIMARRGIAIADHRSRPVTHDLLRQQTVVVAISSDHERFLRSRFPEVSSRLHNLQAFSPDGTTFGDPYGQSLAVYERSAHGIEMAIFNLIDAIERGAFDDVRHDS